MFSPAQIPGALRFGAKQAWIGISVPDEAPA
jgi:hypothetical protein